MEGGKLHAEVVRREIEAVVKLKNTDSVPQRKMKGDGSPPKRGQQDGAFSSQGPKGEVLIE